MKTSSSFPRSAIVVAILGATSLWASEASLVADSKSISAKGGVMMLTASASYDGTPGALGWSIALPGDWQMVAVAGTHVPEVTPATNATGTLEFAYTTPPASSASFIVSVRYPPGTTATKITSVALVRADGRLVTLTPATITVGRGDESDNKVDSSAK
jgi:hypothetical protein